MALRRSLLLIAALAVAAAPPARASAGPVSVPRVLTATYFDISPSPSADVGLNHYVVMANLRYAIYDKNGVLVSGPFVNNLIWTGFRREVERLEIVGSV